MSSWSLEKKICRQKSHKTFRASLWKFGQKSFAHSKTLPAPTPTQQANRLKFRKCLCFAKFKPFFSKDKINLYSARQKESPARQRSPKIYTQIILPGPKHCNPHIEIKKILEQFHTMQSAFPMRRALRRCGDFATAGCRDSVVSSWGGDSGVGGWQVRFHAVALTLAGFSSIGGEMRAVGFVNGQILLGLVGYFVSGAVSCCANGFNFCSSVDRYRLTGTGGCCFSLDFLIVFFAGNV